MPKEKARACVSLRIENSVKKKLERLARADSHRSLGAYCRKVLREHTEREEANDKGE